MSKDTDKDLPPVVDPIPVHKLTMNDLAKLPDFDDQDDQRLLDATPVVIQRPLSKTALVAAALHGCTTAAQRRRIWGSRSLALVVRVPSAGWVKPVIAVLRGKSHWDPAIDGAPPAKKSPDLPHDVAAALSRGGRVLGVSPDPDRYLPAVLLAAADIRLDVRQPSNDVIAATIALSGKGRRPRAMPDDVAAGLDFADIVGALRPGSTPAQCVARLVAASDARTLRDPAVADAPPLDSLHGYGAAMDWCQDLLSDLDGWKRGTAPFPYASRVVLAGPPGTGKTTLARSLAKAAGLPLIATSVAQWFADGPGYLDSVIKAINAVWDQAKAAAPCVVLLDELDAVPNRATMSARGRDWWLPVVTHLLLTLDSAVSGSTKDLIIIGATNHVDDVDAALLRPGRLDRVIHVLPPDDSATRVAMLRTHLGDDLTDADLTLVGVATDRATGADLMGLVKAARRRARVVGRPLAVDDLVAIALPPTDLPDVVDRRCAVHEAGHAVVASALGLHVDLVSLARTKSTGGFMKYAREDAGIHDRAHAERLAQVLLAGMAAEDVLLGGRSTAAGGPAASDLGMATATLAAIRYSHGLADQLTHLGPPDDVLRRMQFDPRLTVKVEADLQRLYSATKALVLEHLAHVQVIAASLRKRRVMTGAAVRDVMSRALLATSPDPPP